MIEVDAHKAVLDALAGLGYMVFDGKPPARDVSGVPAEFVTVYPGGMPGGIDRVCGDQGDVDLAWLVVCASATSVGCITVTGRVRRVLSGFRPSDRLSDGPMVERAASMSPVWDGELANRRASLTLEFHMSARRD